MKVPPLVSHSVIVMLLLFAALAASSCDSVSGVGVGVGTTARWGGSTSSPPIFVGGPSMR
jgi:predicted small secreted protein